MKLKKLNLLLSVAFAPALFCASNQSAYADISPVSGVLTGQYSNGQDSSNSSGIVLASASAQPNFTIGLETVTTGYNGNVSTGTLAASAANTAQGGTLATPAQSSITYTGTVTNTSTVATAYQFTINLSNSRLIISTDTGGFGPYGVAGAGGTIDASINASVKVNGSNVWSSGADLNVVSSTEIKQATTTIDPVTQVYNDNQNYVLTTTGNAFNSTTIDRNQTAYRTAYYEQVVFGDYSETISLGTLLPGQSETVSYELSAGTSLTNLTNGGFYGYGGAVADIGDPLSVSGTPQFSIAVATPLSAVPEESTAAMMGAGLMLLAGTVRRKKLRNSVK